MIYPGKHSHQLRVFIRPSVFS